MNKAYNAINWKNEPSTSTAINETNLNKMDRAIDTIDNRVISLDSEKVSKEEGKSLVSNTDISKIGSNENAIQTHISNKSNPHSVTKAQVGLGNVDNTSDVNKPISTAQQAEFDAINSNLDTLAFGLESGSSNIIECEDISFLANTNKEIKIFELNLKAGTYTLSWTQATTLTSITRNTPFYIKNSSRIYMNGSENYNLIEKRYKWTFTLESDSYIEMYYWCHTPNTDVAYKDFKLELGTQATPYEPYIPSVEMLAEENAQQNTEAMDLKMLGWTVPSECPVQNYVDSDGVFHQRVGRVDLGSLKFEYDANVFFTKISQKNIYCYLYKFVDDTRVVDNTTAGNYLENMTFTYRHGTIDRIYFKNTSYTDVTTFKNAMKGVYLYYELDTPITITIDGNEVTERINESLDGLKSDLSKQCKKDDITTNETLIGTFNGKNYYRKLFTGISGSGGSVTVNVGGKIEIYNYYGRAYMYGQSGASDVKYPIPNKNYYIESQSISETSFQLTMPTSSDMRKIDLVIEYTKVDE